MSENQDLVPGTPVEPSSDPKRSLNWYITKRSGRKRDYIFDAGKMKVCPHNRLHALATGGNWYRCEDCNWAFCITQAYVQPLHNVVVGGLLNALHFSKEFGADALNEVLRTPKGQHEADYHLPALPEGMNFWDAVEALEEIDVNTADMGKTQLGELFEKKWIPLAERRRRNKELGRPMPEQPNQVEPGFMKALGATTKETNGTGDSGGVGAGTLRKAVSPRRKVSSVSRRRKVTNPKGGDSGES